MRKFRIVLVVLVVTSSSLMAEDASFFVSQSDVKGGLAVIVDGEVEQAAELHSTGRFLVFMLSSEAGSTAELRSELRKKNLLQHVSADRLRGNSLPFSDRLVNLLVAPKGLDGVEESEVRRVLAPHGAALVKNGNSWRSVRQPWPDTLDDWTHYLHGPSGNAVSQDAEISEPKGMQWLASPRWHRHHGRNAGVSALVSSKGRLFGIIDEGAVAHSLGKAKWFLVGRDAFSGVRLWDKPIEGWERMKEHFRAGPAWFTRRLVAEGDRVFATLALDAPVTALDAATGETLETYEQTAHAQEIVYRDGVLYVVTGVPLESEKWLWNKPTDHANLTSLVAVDAETGSVLWKKDGGEFSQIQPLTVAVNERILSVHTQNRLYGLDPESGKELWSIPRKAFRVRPGWSNPTVVLADDVLLVADRDSSVALSDLGNSKKRVQQAPAGRLVYVRKANMCRGKEGTLVALDAETGKELWTAPCAGGFSAPADVLYADGLVWIGTDPSRTGNDFTAGRDLHTGEIVRRLDTKKAFPQTHHHRCYRDKATERFILLGRTGTEFIDLSGEGNHDRNCWVRGTCQYGVMPANGLVYAPPHSCGCFPEAKLAGFWALSSKSNLTDRVPNEERLLKGEAYSSPDSRASALVSSAESEWPTYRHDPQRTGSTSATAGSIEELTWEKEFSSRLSAPTVANGRVYVAEVDASTVHCLSEADGSHRWSFTAGGRVDSPPTVYKGRVYFGSADGRVYCLDAERGELIWSFLAAPLRRLVVSRDRVESAWPVHGSVLIHKGALWASAGRSSYLDNGIALWKLDPQTGDILARKQYCHYGVETGLMDEVKDGQRMIGGKNDVLSAGEGETAFMRHTHFDGQLEEIDPGLHVYSAAGLLDGEWFNRTYWIYGMRMWGEFKGWPTSASVFPSGRILSLEEDNTLYGFRRPGHSWGLEDRNDYFLYRASFSPGKLRELVPPDDGYPWSRWKRNHENPAIQKEWETREIPVWARAMVSTENSLLVAGPLKPEKPRGVDVEQLLAGKRGAKLLVISKENGEVHKELELSAPPVWDGMAVIPNTVILSCRDNSLRCWRSR